MKSSVTTSQIPVFAIVGHPNEGKSSVISTLCENDSIAVSPIPGETKTSTIYPIFMNNQEMVRFIDTPGFQNPHYILQFLNKSETDISSALQDFVKTHQSMDDFADDCQLMQAILNCSGLIFVVNGSRPLREVDKIEMEILRLTSLPRLALINNKDDDSTHIQDWENEFRKNFNAIRQFNSNKAVYSDRISLLNSMKFIDQKLESLMDNIIQAIEQDWNKRIKSLSTLTIQYLSDLITYRCSKVLNNDPLSVQKESIQKKYNLHINNQERKVQVQIRELFRHNQADFLLPQQSILQHDIFSEQTWKFLGLTSAQLIVAGILGGAAVGVGVDALVAGHSLGAFAAIGGALGGIATAWKGKDILSGQKIMGLQLDKDEITMGPISNHQFIYIALDRVLIYFHHIALWAHGKRNYQVNAIDLSTQKEKIGYTHRWQAKEHQVCNEFFKSVAKNNQSQRLKSEDKFINLITEKLQEISNAKN